MFTYPVYAALSTGLGIFRVITVPGYNPSFDFGIALILLGLYSRGPRDREV